jgi:hypothetical protein
VTEKSLADVLGRYAASSHSRNGTIEALADAYPETAVAVLAEVPFSSRWRFSGLEFADGAFVIGAPELSRSASWGSRRDARRGGGGACWRSWASRTGSMASSPSRDRRRTRNRSG